MEDLRDLHDLTMHDVKPHTASQALNDRFHATREHLSRGQEPLPGQQGQNLALTVFYVPHIAPHASFKNGSKARPEPGGSGRK